MQVNVKPNLFTLGKKDFAVCPFQLVSYIILKIKCYSLLLKSICV